MKRLLWLLPAVALLYSCSDADSLGDEPPREVTITSATYNGGIGELLALKCGYCHAWPRPDTAPDNVVEDMDLTDIEDDLAGEPALMDKVIALWSPFCQMVRTC